MIIQICVHTGQAAFWAALKTLTSNRRSKQLQIFSCHGMFIEESATSLKICHRCPMSFSHCCCYGFLSTPKPLPLNRREVIHGDALKWLYQLGPKGFPEKACVVTSLPDWSEMKKGQNMSLKEYLEWFKKAHGALQFLEIRTIKENTTKCREGRKGVWGAMGGGTKTMVGVVLPWKSMTNGGLDPIKPPKKMGDLFSFSGDLSFSSCLPAIPSARHFNSFFIVVIQILWRLGWIWRSGVTKMINPQLCA